MRTHGACRRRPARDAREAPLGPGENLSDAAGGPFTGAAVVSISPATAGTAGTAAIGDAGGTYDLTFTPTGTFSGVATVTFTLANAFGTTSGTVAVTVEARPDPALDAEVRGVATSQVTSARRFAEVQISNFQRRLQDLHDGDNGSSNGVSLNFGFGNDADNDPRVALRRQLGGGRETVDPDAVGGDRERTAGPDAGGSATDRPAAAPSSAESGRRSALGFWTAGSVDWGRQDAQGQRDYRFTTQGVTVGLDVRVSDQLIVGGGLGYGEDKTKIGDSGSVSNGRGLTGALYASWRPAKAFYIDGVVGWSDLDFESRRWAQGLAGQPGAYAEGERSGDARFLSAAFGRVLRGENMTSEFCARVDARSISLDGFTETGAGLSSLVWDAVDQDSVSGNLGAARRCAGGSNTVSTVSSSRPPGSSGRTSSRTSAIRACATPTGPPARPIWSRWTPGRATACASTSGPTGRWMSSWCSASAIERASATRAQATAARSAKLGW